MKQKSRDFTITEKEYDRVRFELVLGKNPCLTRMWWGNLQTVSVVAVYRLWNEHQKSYTYHATCTISKEDT